MGVELLLVGLGLAKGTEPDWLAAAAAIDDLTLETIWDTGDEFFPWENWLEDNDLDEPGDIPDPVPVWLAIAAAQRDLREAAAIVRQIVEDPEPTEVLVIDIPTDRVFLTGAMTGGDSPGLVFEAFSVFGEAGIAEAAGFQWLIEQTATPIRDRRLGFRPEELRVINAARAFAYIEPLSRSLIPHYREGEPEDWIARWTAPFANATSVVHTDDATTRMAAGTSLMLFLAETHALVLALEQSAPEWAGRDINDIVREEVALLGEEHLVLPASSADEIVLGLDDPILEFEGLLRAVAGRGDVAFATALAEGVESSLQRMLSVRLMVTVLIQGITRVADVFGPELPTIRPGESVPVEASDALAARRGASVIRYCDYFAWCALDAPNWGAAEQAVDESGASDRAKLRAYLEEFREVLEDADQYFRYETSIEMGTCSVWITAGEPAHWRALGEHGIFSAAGAVAWG